MPRFLTLALTLTMLVLTGHRASAWNSVGHMTIAKLAYDQLEPNRQLAQARAATRGPFQKSRIRPSPTATPIE